MLSPAGLPPKRTPAKVLPRGLLWLLLLLVRPTSPATIIRRIRLGISRPTSRLRVEVVLPQLALLTAPGLATGLAMELIWDRLEAPRGVIAGSLRVARIGAPTDHLRCPRDLKTSSLAALVGGRCGVRVGFWVARRWWRRFLATGAHCPQRIMCRPFRLIGSRAGGRTLGQVSWL